MSKNLPYWHRESYRPNITAPSLPPIKKNFFDEHSTPLGEEGTQNTGDNSQDGKKPKIKISLVKVSSDFFHKNLVDENFKNFIDKSDAIEKENKDILNKKIKEVPCLLFEDFNTTGITGDPDIHKRKIDEKRNDFYAFWWSIFSGDKEKGKGGSVGIGRLTFAYSSNIQTFFSYSVPSDKKKGKKIFCGLSVLGKNEDKNGNSLDPFARFGVMKNDFFSPVMDDDKLKEIHQGLKLTREFDEPGLSMIVPFPNQEVCSWKLMYKNIVDRYRYAIFNNQIELEINGQILNKEKIIDFVKKHLPDELSKYKKYFDFLNNVSAFNNEDFFILKIDEHSSKFKKNFISKEELDRLSKDFDNEKLIGVKATFKIEKQDNSSFDALVKFFIKKTESNHGCDDLIRQLMPVSGERKFDQRDVHGLTIIDDQETAEFCRLSESENHKTFDAATLKEKNIYIRPSNEIRLIKNLSESFHNALVESDAESKSIDATRDWFGFGDDDENEDESSSDTDGNGKVTKFKIPKYLFDDPKIYEIRKLEKSKKYGFAISGSDVEKETQKNIDEINKLIEIDKKKKEKKELKDDESKEKDITEDDLNRLKKQKKKLEKRLSNNCKDLYPCNVRLHIYEDLQKYGGKRSKKFYDPINDFHFKKDIGSKFKIEKKGLKNLDEGGEEGNLISFQVENSDFYYELITNKLSSKKGVPSDLTIRPWVGKIEN